MAEQAFDRAFADAIARRGVTLAWLNRRLAERGRPVSVTALSYWRSGRSQPERKTSRDAVDEIEQLRGVDRGGLSSLIGPSRRPGPQPAERSVKEMFAAKPGIQPALAALGFEGLYDELTDITRVITVDLDEGGRVCRDEERILMQARRDGARRWPVIITVDEGKTFPQLVPVTGCAVGRTWLDPENGVLAAELVLDRELAAGDTHLVENRMVFHEPVTDTRWAHYAPRRLRSLLIWVRFHPDRVPHTVERHLRDDNGERVEILHLGGGSSVHVLEHGFGPGMLGIRWTW
jgi:hypothetical protein